jgi:hypothetical protein
MEEATKDMNAFYEKIN